MLSTSPKGLRCILYVVALAFWALFAFVMLEKFDGSLSKYRNVARRKPAEHFFFDLLSGFDPPYRGVGYSVIPRNSKTMFVDIIDRELLSKYLVRRFAFTNYLQIGCENIEITEFLPDSVAQKDCVNYDKGRALLSDVSQDISVKPNPLSSTSTVKSKSSSLTKYGIILINGHGLERDSQTASPKELTELVQSAISSLEDGGILILTDTNPPLPNPNEPNGNKLRYPMWSVATRLKLFVDIDYSTLDADGGLTVVKLETPNGLASPRGMLRSSDNGKADPGVTDATSPSASTATPSWADVTSPTERDRLLKLVSFEELHNWLAPTGNVDAVTAFGGEAAVALWREMQAARRRCSKLLAGSTGNHRQPVRGGEERVESRSEVSDVERQSVPTNRSAREEVLNCFNDLLVTGKASLKARAQLALLLLQEGRLVDAVTLLGELQSAAPQWNRWVWRELSGMTAASFDRAVPTPGPWKEPIPEAQKSIEGAKDSVANNV